MSEVAYHAWTHRPKAQGGTDPIEMPAGFDMVHLWDWDYDTDNSVTTATWEPVVGIGGSDRYYNRATYSSGFTTGWDYDSGLNTSVSAEYLIQGWVQFWEDATAGEQRFVALNLGSGIRHIAEFVAVTATVGHLALPLPVQCITFGTSQADLEVWHNHGSDITIRDAEIRSIRLFRETDLTTEFRP